jgi:penicillin-binding protein 1A
MARSTKPTKGATPKAAPKTGRAKATGANKKAAPRLWWQTLLRWAVILCIIGAVAGLSGVAGLFYYYSRDLPQILKREDFKPPQISRVYASSGELVGELYRTGGKRTVVPMEQIPVHVRSAFMAAEDADFMTHPGIDYLSLVRAFYNAIVHDTGFKGTSTITQQVVKNLILSPEKSLKRKIQEVILSRELEQKLSKDDILWLYLNEVYLGHGVNGVEEAAQVYFGKHIQDLSLEEACVLAGINQGPELLTPHRYPEKALKRRAYVLRQLWQKGFIEEAVYRKADASELKVVQRSSANPYLGVAPHFVDQVRRELIERLGEDKVYAGGLRVYTTLDIKVQRDLEAAVVDSIGDYDGRHKLYQPTQKLDPKKVDAFVNTQAKQTRGKLDRRTTYEAVVTQVVADPPRVDLMIGDVAGKLDLKPHERIFGTGKAEKKVEELFSPGHVLRVKKIDDDVRDPSIAIMRFEDGPEVGAIVMDPLSREVVALVGGVDFATNKFNHAIQARRQTGSTFKPIVYAAALEAGVITPATILLDSPRSFPLPGGKVYSPKNSDGQWRGPIRVREAIGSSRNAASMLVLELLEGPNTTRPAKASAFAQRLGLPADKLSDNLTMALGSSEMTVMEMTNAYAVFASGGMYSSPRLIARVESTRNESVPIEQRVEPVLAPEVAYLISSLMTSVVQGYIDHDGKKRAGTASIIDKLGRPVAGKTGTTNEARDAWFVGFTPEYVTAVWVGYDDNRTLGKGEYGGKVAAPIWLAAMKAALKGKPKHDFTPPATGITEASIDPATGLLARTGGIREEFITGSAPTDYAPEEGIQGDDTFILNQVGATP